VKHFILGTAGHVDHGKSSLIKALTNVDTDRLPEEKERGLSIELGFAPLELEGSDGPIHLGVVDVPGHHKFLRNMIAGVGGFDAALLVVDCCEGVKPQTKEHLQILEMLQTGRGIVALSKVDKIDDDSLEIARWEMEELLAGSFLDGAPIIATSAQTGKGLDELKAALYKLLISEPERNSQGVVRLPLDRSFSKVGFGTVGTGSLWSGTLKVGDDVELLPDGCGGKVRGLQVHGESVECALPGQRVAVNISGLDKGDIGRGQTLVSPPGSLPLSQRFAVSVSLLQPEPKMLQRKFKATFFQGTSHYQISVNLVGDNEQATEVYGQLLFPEPVLLCRSDRFLLRDETDIRLVGGGTVLALEEKPFKRSQAKKLLARYKALAGGGEVGRLLQFLREKGGWARTAAVKKQLGLSHEEWERQLELFLDSGKVLLLGKDRLWESEIFDQLRASLLDLLGKLVEAARWKMGWTAQELASLMRMQTGQAIHEVLDALIERGELKATGPFYAPTEHQPQLGGESKKKAERVVNLLDEDGFSPRDWESCLGEVTGHDKKLCEKLEEYLLGTERVTRLSDKLVTTLGVMERARDQLAGSFQDGFTASEARQNLDTSRKFIIPILEWMDQKGWTLRLGDKRVMRNSAAS
jgi:selenocysteine-specific elongation factor